MSRAGYSDDIDNWVMIKWRGQVMSATRGKRGQALFRDLLSSLDSMPEKALVIGELQDSSGNVCALGALGRDRGIDMSKVDPEDPEQVAKAFDIAEQLAREIVYMNDEQCDSKWDDAAKRHVDSTPEERWVMMRKWVAAQIRNTLTAAEMRREGEL